MLTHLIFFVCFYFFIFWHTLVKFLAPPLYTAVKIEGWRRKEGWVYSMFVGRLREEVKNAPHVNPCYIWHLLQTRRKIAFWPACKWNRFGYWLQKILNLWYVNQSLLTFHDQTQKVCQIEAYVLAYLVCVLKEVKLVFTS